MEKISANSKQKHGTVCNAKHTEEQSACTWRFSRNCNTTNGDYLNYLRNEIEAYRGCKAKNIKNLTNPHNFEARVN